MKPKAHPAIQPSTHPLIHLLYPLSEPMPAVIRRIQGQTMNKDTATKENEIAIYRPEPHKCNGFQCRCKTAKKYQKKVCCLLQYCYHCHISPPRVEQSRAQPLAAQLQTMESQSDPISCKKWLASNSQTQLIRDIIREGAVLHFWLGFSRVKPSWNKQHQLCRCDPDPSPCTAQNGQRRPASCRKRSARSSQTWLIRATIKESVRDCFFMVSLRIKTQMEQTVPLPLWPWPISVHSTVSLPASWEEPSEENQQLQNKEDWRRNAVLPCLLTCAQDFVAISRARLRLC